MGVHGNMLERAYINMLGKFRNMENPVQYASEKSQYRALVAFFGIFQYADWGVFWA